MKIKKLLCVALTTVMALSLMACSGGKKEDVYHVGICQLIQHVALDAATQGFKDALIEEFGEGKIVFDEQNAQGDSATCATIVNGFVSNNYDLIMANATAALQAAAAATATIPVVGTSITDYATALGLSNFNGVVGGNVTGASDLAPLDKQAEMIQELFPDAKKIGLVYCSAEANSKYQIDAVKGYLEGMGYTCTEYAFADSNDISSVVTLATENEEVLYIPTDNTAANNTEIINNICEPAGIPIVAGEEGICKGCGIATLSISYYDLGVATGEMAASVLKGGDISTMKVTYAAATTKEYVAARAEKLGVTIPDGYIAIE